MVPSSRTLIAAAPQRYASAALPLMRPLSWRQLTALDPTGKGRCVSSHERDLALAPHDDGVMSHGRLA
jgi:hypothetical protein